MLLRPKTIHFLAAKIIRQIVLNFKSQIREVFILQIIVKYLLNR